MLLLNNIIITKNIEYGIIGKINKDNIILIFNDYEKFNKNLLLFQNIKIINKHIINPPYYNIDILINENLYNVRIIFPAKLKHLNKYNNQNKKIISETYEQYLKTPKEIPNWVLNIIEKKSEIPIYESDKFLIINDYKWNGNIDNLYLTLFFKDFNLFSIREITKLHILDSLLIIDEVLKNTFNLKSNDCLMYFHYKPTYDLLHMHIFNLKGNVSKTHCVGRAILVQDVLRNLEIDKDYYKKAILYFIS